MYIVRAIALFLVGASLFACAEEASPPPIRIGEGEGEGEALVPYAFEHGGSIIEGDLVLLHDEAAPLTLGLAIRNVSEAELSILSDPPVLLGGADASLFAIPVQPATTIAPSTSAPFTLVYTPRTTGVHEGLLLFAYGLSRDERGLLRVEVEATAAITQPGVRYAIYDGTFDFLPDFSTLTAVETGVTSRFDISARADGDLFAYVFEGSLAVPAAGSYTFFTTSDDGSRLFIDGAVVVDNDGLHAALERSGAVDLTAGSHAIRVEFFEKLGAASLLVEWQGPTVARAEIPADVLSVP